MNLFNRSAEGAVIGSLLIDPNCAPEVFDIIQAEDLFEEEPRHIFEAIQRLWNAQQPIDPVLVRANLVLVGQMTDETFQYLVSALQTTPHAANALYYAHLVEQKAAERELITHAHNANQAARDDTLNYSEKIETLQQIITSLPTKRADYELAKVLDIGSRQREQQKTGLKSSFIKLDRLTGGFHPGDVVIVAGRPGVGKSCFLQSIFIEMSRHRLIPAFYSLEMSPLQIVERILCYEAGVGKDFIDAEGAKVVREFILADKWQGYIPTDVFSIGQIETSVMSMRQRGVNVVFIDYIQIIAISSKHNRYQQITEISRRLKQLALTAELPVILACQLNRSCAGRDDHKPRLSDLRDSGSIEQDADMILLLHRDDYYRKEGEEQDGKAICHLAKNRQGRTGIVPLIFSPEQFKFTTMCEEKNGNI